MTRSATKWPWDFGFVSSIYGICLSVITFGLYSHLLSVTQSYLLSSIGIMLALGVILLLQTFFAVPIIAAPLSIHIRSFIDLFNRADTCNGNAALCDRKYSNLTFIGTHDSAFVGPLLAQNQIKSITEQLNGGIRYLQSQTHYVDNVLKMCHTSCALEDAGPVEKYLREVKTWMDANPRDVVTLLLVNGDKVPMSTFDDVFKKVGLDQISFKPDRALSPLATSAWPTIGDMITSGQRLVTFIGA